MTYKDLLLEEYPKFQTEAQKADFQKEILAGIEKYQPAGHRDIMFQEVFGGPLLVMRHTAYTPIQQEIKSIKGRYDGPLSERGENFGIYVAENLQRYLPKGIVIVSSTAQRAVETANLLSEQLERFDTLTVKKLHLDEFCEGHYKKMTKGYIYNTLRSHNIYNRKGISCVTILISHEPNVQTYYTSIGGANKYLELGYMDIITEDRNIFKQGHPQMD